MNKTLMASFVSLLAASAAMPGTAAAQDLAPQEELAPEAESDSVPGWFRIDTDRLGTQFWVGATHPLGPVDLATDIYVVGPFAELDVGIAFEVGPVSLLPMVGIGFDFARQEADTLIAPQLFTIIDQGPIYFESWIQGFFNSMFDEGDPDTLYTRNFVLYKVSDWVAIGPQVELDISLKNKLNNVDGDEATISFLPAGGRLNLHYGENNTLGLFLGFDITASDLDGAMQEDGTVLERGKLAGRFTFVRTW